MVKLAVAVPPVNTLPPVDAAYQSIVSPAPAPVTLIFTVPGPHILSSKATNKLDGKSFTVTTHVPAETSKVVLHELSIAYLL